MSTQPAIDPLEVAYERGRAEGWAAARAEIGDCWCPVPKRWRLVAEGDHIEGPSDGRVWGIDRLERTPAGMYVPTLHRKGQDLTPRDRNGAVILFDPDSEVPVLERMSTIDALQLLRNNKIDPHLPPYGASIVAQETT